MNLGDYSLDVSDGVAYQFFAPTRIICSPRVAIYLGLRYPRAIKGTPKQRRLTNTRRNQMLRKGKSWGPNHTSRMLPIGKWFKRPIIVIDHDRQHVRVYDENDH